ncbi:zinc finger, CCHC-type containing protein [Tanacetum coccineum]
MVKRKRQEGFAPNNAPYSAPKPKTPHHLRRDNQQRDTICHQCGEVGHWRRNCPVYLAELMKKKKLSQEASTLESEASGSVEDLELIQEEDTNPSVDTSLNHKEDDQEIDEPQSDINPIRRSIRTRRPTDRLCLYIDAEEHELGDLDEPANYKAAWLDPESKKCTDAMNLNAIHERQDVRP